MSDMETTAAEYNAMIAEFGTTPDICQHCRREVWWDTEAGIYFDVRVLTGDAWSFRCDLYGDAHEAV